MRCVPTVLRGRIGADLLGPAAYFEEAHARRPLADGIAYLVGLPERRLDPGPIENVNKGVQLSAVTDPDGNTITFIGNFRIRY
jgi:hypothetical protein